MSSDELDVEGPDAVVLGEWQGDQSVVKCASCLCDLPLVHEELAVVHPDTRHLHMTHRREDGFIKILKGCVCRN